MPCYKTLAMTAATLGETPLQDAVYVAATDKIYGVSGIYVVQFNATTGAKESEVRISSPVNNGTRICYHAATGLLYATVWNEPNLGNTALTHPNKDVYPINPAMMTVGARLDVLTNTGFIVNDDFDSALNPAWGPKWIGSQGDYLYLQWNQSSFYYVIRFNPTNFADRCTQGGDDCGITQSEQLAVGPVYIMSPDADNDGIEYAIIGWNNQAEWDRCDIVGYQPVACEYCSFDGLTYAVDGNGNMFRVNDPTIDDVTIFDMTATLAGADACRLRWNVYDGLIYFPCQTTNSIMRFDPNTVAWEATKTGFENPVDLVFTGTKVFAVQNSPDEPLREVV